MAVNDDVEVKIPILRIFESYQYRLPGFPGITVYLRHVKYQASNTNEVFDGFIKDGVNVDRPYPAVAIIDVSPEKAWFIKVSS